MKLTINTTSIGDKVRSRPGPGVEDDLFPDIYTRDSGEGEGGGAWSARCARNVPSAPRVAQRCSAG